MSQATTDDQRFTAVDYDPFAQPAIERVVPVTEPQREVWLACRLGEEASLAYSEALRIRLRGPLRVDALRAAVAELPRRHDVLRATFSEDGDELRIAASQAIELLVHAAGDAGAADAESRLAARERLAVQTPFDLERGPLLRAELLPMGTDDHVLLLAAHHIVCDGWSFGILVHDLAACYSALVDRAIVPLPAAAAFADYALAQARGDGTEQLAEDAAYWTARYEHAAPILDLPSDLPRPRVRGFAAGREDLVIDAGLVDAVRQLGAKHGASLFVTLFTAYAELLRRLAQVDEVVVGIASAGQADAADSNLVGHCVNILPLRTERAQGLGVVEALGAARAVVLDAIEHRRLGLGALLKRVALPRDPSRLPLVGALFNLDQRLEAGDGAFVQIEAEIGAVARSHENFELFLNVVPIGGALRCECQYSQDLYAGATVQRWLRCLRALLAAMVAEPGEAISALTMIDADEKLQLYALQPPATAYEAGVLAHQWFERQADRDPARRAVSAGDRWLSYAEVESRANRIANLLRTRGVRAGDVVGLALDRGVDLVVAMLGILKAGAGYLALDPAFPAERLRWMAGDAALAAIVCGADLSLPMDPLVPRVDLGDASGELAAADATRPADSGAGPDSPAYLIYTSGSTGRPKGVRVAHRNSANFLASMLREPGIRPDDRLVAVTTPGFDIAFLELMLPLCLGAEVVVANGHEVRDGGLLRALLERCGASYMQATPSGWRMLIEGGWTGAAGFRAVTGGEPLPEDLAAALLQRCEEVWNGYGPTETTIYSTFWRVREPRHGIRIGRPIANTTVWILDAHGGLCPLGVPGEIYIGGDGVSGGYVGRADLTAERFVPDPFAGGAAARLYRTGDRGRWLADGNLQHLGRLDFQVKVRGYRIELGEVEAVLCRHPDVAQAVVVVREDQPGDVRLVAYAIASAGSGPTDASLLAHLQQHLPQYMLPQHLLVLERLPQLPNGKVDRKALPQPVLQRVVTSEAFVAPRDPTEQAVAEEMESVLALPGLSVHDDFFRLGGHSLLAARLTARLNRRFAVALSFRTLFDAPTIAGLAGAIAAQRAAGAAPPAPAIERLAEQARAPLSLMQERLWFLEQLHPGRVTYNTPSAHRLRGSLDELAFARAFDAMVQRQPSLRTSVAEIDGVPVQVVAPSLSIALFPALDLGEVPAAEQEAALLQVLQALTDEPFDLGQPPLFRVRMIRLGPAEHVLFFMPHHLIWDGWSFDILYAELSTLYAAHRAGRPSPLPELAVSYSDFAVWHHQWLEGPQLQQQLALWRQRLATLGDLQELPTDRPRRPGMSGSGRTAWMALPPELTAALHRLATRLDATLNMVMMALFYLLLHGHTGMRQLVVGTPVRGRNMDEVESVMGYFTNLLPVPVVIEPGDDFERLVATVKRELVESFGAPDVPLELMQRELRVRRGEAGQLLYHALFSFQDARGRSTDWAGLAHSQIPLFQGGATEDLGIWFLENGEGLVGGITYNADILLDATAELLRDRLLELAARVVVEPGLAVAELATAGASDRRLLDRWQRSMAVTVPQDLLAALRAHEASDGARLAIDDGGWGMQRRALLSAVDGLSARLRRAGLRGGERVLVVVGALPAGIVELLAVLAAGASCVVLEAGVAAPRLRSLAQQAGVGFVVGPRALGGALDWGTRPALWTDEAEGPAIEPPGTTDELPLAVDPSLAALVMIDRSGPEPGPIEVLDRGALSSILAGMVEVLGVRPDWRVAVHPALSPGLGILQCLLPIFAGACLVDPGEVDGRDIDGLRRQLQARTWDLASLPTDILWRLQEHGWRAGPSQCVVRHGPANSPVRQRALLEACGPHWVAQDSVAGGWFALARIARGDETGRVAEPLLRARLQVVGDDGGALPVGRRGRIEIMAFQDAGATMPARESVPTGRRGRWLADGSIEVEEHDADLLFVQGHPLRRGAFESWLRQQAALADAALFADADGRVAVVVVADANATVDSVECAASLQSRWPTLVGPPRVVSTPVLPRTVDGGLDLPRLAREHAADQGRPPTEDARPQGSTESTLAAIWAELLGVVDVRRHDNFFDLGGHSLLVMQVIERMERATGKQVAARNYVFQSLAQVAHGYDEASAQPVAVGGALRRWLSGLLGGGTTGKDA